MISYGKQLCGSGEEEMEKVLVTTWLEENLIGRNLNEEGVMEGQYKNSFSKHIIKKRCDEKSLSGDKWMMAGRSARGMWFKRK